MAIYVALGRRGDRFGEKLTGIGKAKEDKPAKSFVISHAAASSCQIS